jgi:hypothetical protein
MHCCVEVTESSTNKQHHLSLVGSGDVAWGSGLRIGWKRGRAPGAALPSACVSAVQVICRNVCTVRCNSDAVLYGILLLHIISVRPSKQPLMVRNFLKVYMELGSYFLFLQEQIKDIIIITQPTVLWGQCPGCWHGGLYHQCTQILAG